jgi:hypothetical protein
LKRKKKEGKGKGKGNKEKEKRTRTREHQQNKCQFNPFHLQQSFKRSHKTLKEATNPISLK